MSTNTCPAVAVRQVHDNGIVYVSRSTWFGNGRNGIFAHRDCNGDPIDYFEAGGSCWGAAVVVNGAIFFGCEDKFRAVKLNTNTKDEGDDHFAAAASHLLDEGVSSTPRLSNSDETMYVVTDSGNLRALQVPAAADLGVDEKDFDVVWRHGPAETGERGGPTSSPALSPDGTRIYYVTYQATLFCLNSSTGAVLWNSRTAPTPRINLGNDPVKASPITNYAGTTVFIGSTTGFGAFDAATGSKKWFVRGASDVIGGLSSGSSGSAHSYQLTTAAMNLPEHDDTVFVGSSNFKLYALDAETGGYKWAGHDFVTNDDVMGTPLHHPYEQVVYFGGNDRQLRAVK
jgi:outer membrane protein assembly factor BamB